MASKLCIVCSEAVYTDVLAAVHRLPVNEFDFSGNEKQWKSIALTFPVGSIRLTSMTRVLPGDRFSKLILSMHNFFRAVETDAVSKKTAVLSRVALAKMLIGVVAEPEFVQDDKRLEYLWTIAEEIDARLFNGHAMLDSHGRRILSKDGEYDVLRS